LADRGAGVSEPLGSCAGAKRINCGPIVAASAPRAAREMKVRRLR
jgi:hypothetical protein